MKIILPGRRDPMQRAQIGDRHPLGKWQAPCRLAFPAHPTITFVWYLTRRITRGIGDGLVVHSAQTARDGEMEVVGVNDPCENGAERHYQRLREERRCAGRIPTAAAMFVKPGLRDVLIDDVACG